MPKPTKDVLPWACNKCHHKWVAAYKLPMPVERMAKQMAKTKCPKCGSHDVSVTFGN